MFKENIDHKWAAKYRSRLESGAWRSPIFRDLVQDAIHSVGGPATVLDIGCGRGFDDDPKLQQSLIAAAGRYIGVEPDRDIEIHPQIEVHRTTLEQAAIEPGTIDVAFATMVLEHVSDPVAFFASVWGALKPGGIFLGFTPNKGHYFVFCSSLFERLGLKDRYLRLLRKNSGGYENYPTLYRCNSASVIDGIAVGFEVESAVFATPRIAVGYLPLRLQPLGLAFEWAWSAARLPGGILVCRVEKAGRESLREQVPQLLSGQRGVQSLLDAR